LIFLILLSLLIGCTDPVSSPDSIHNNNAESQGMQAMIMNRGMEMTRMTGSGDSPAEPAFQQRDVIISEVMVRQQETLADPDFNAYSGWIELHNLENNPVDISGWVVGFRPGSLQHRRGILGAGPSLPRCDTG
jgi:hypothetical protein